MFFSSSPEQKLKKIITWVRELKINVPSNTTEFRQITKLDLSSKGLTKIPSEIGCLENLQELNISYNKVKELPKEVKGMKSLKILNMGYNQFPSIPECIFHLKELELLNMEANNIKKLPATISDLTKLQNINFFANSISELPDSICNLTNLTRINFALNLLSKLPTSFENLKNITELELWLNKFELIPTVVSKLPNLKNSYDSFDTEKLNKALIMAVFADNISLVSKLIFHGADVNYELEGFGSQLYTTPLFEIKSVEMAQLLISKGADYKFKREIIKHVLTKTGEEEIRNTGNYETFFSIKHNDKIEKFKKTLAQPEVFTVKEKTKQEEDDGIF